MGVSAGPKIETGGLVFALDARNVKTYDEIPGITDHGISDWYCFISGTATYSAIYPNTEIIEIDADGNETVVVTTGSDPQKGDLSITAGRRYYGTKAIHILDEGPNDAIAPVSFAGTYFGNIHTRYDPKTVNIYAPQDDINVSVYEDVTGGVTGTATSTFSISRGSSDTYVTTTGINNYTILETDKPAIMTVGSDGDDHVMMPMSQYAYRRRYDSGRPGRTINNTAPSNLNDNTYILYDTSLPVFSLEVGDGSGNDSTQGIGYEYLSDTFSWGNVLSDYQIVAPYADTTVTVSYWADSQWNVGETHSLSGTQTNPDAAFREGNTGFGSAGAPANDSGQAANLASGANLWKWESTKPIALIINDSADDEENMLGWMSNKYLRTSSNVTQSFVNLIDKDDRSRMKIYGKDLTTTIEYAGAKLSADDYIEFDGDDDHINLGVISTSNPLQMNDPSGGGLTLTWWGYFDNTGDDFQRIFDKSSAGSATNGWAVYVGDVGSNALLKLASNNSDQIISNSYFTSTWQNWCVTWVKSSGTYVTYLNGVQDRTGTRTWDIPSVETQASIGSWNHSTGREYNGNIASLKIYDKALTASEVKQNFNAFRGRFGI